MNNDRHVYPLDEEHLHIVSGPTSGTDCPCKPRVEVVGSDLIVIHNAMHILRGLDDVPAIAEQTCGRCDGALPETPWFEFIEADGQRYKRPICNDCDKKDSPAGGEVTP